MSNGFHDPGIRKAVVAMLLFVMWTLAYFTGEELGRMEGNVIEGKRIVAERHITRVR